MLWLISAQLINGIAIGMIYALMALGLSIIKGLLNIPNFAHGALYALGAYVCYSVSSSGAPFALGLLAAFLAAGLAGLALDRLAIRPVGAGGYLPQLIVLFGAALIIEQVLLIGWGTIGLSYSPPPLLRGAFDLETRVPAGVPFGMQPVSAVDAWGESATAALQVRWGGWPPLVAVTCIASVIGCAGCGCGATAGVGEVGDDLPQPTHTASATVSSLSFMGYAAYRPTSTGALSGQRATNGVRLTAPLGSTSGSMLPTGRA